MEVVTSLGNDVLIHWNGRPVNDDDALDGNLCDVLHEKIYSIQRKCLSYGRNTSNTSKSKCSRYAMEFTLCVIFHIEHRGGRTKTTYKASCHFGNFQDSMVNSLQHNIFVCSICGYISTILQHYSTGLCGVDETTSNDKLVRPPITQLKDIVLLGDASEKLQALYKTKCSSLADGEECYSNENANCCHYDCGLVHTNHLFRPFWDDTTNKNNAYLTILGSINAIKSAKRLANCANNFGKTKALVLGLLSMEKPTILSNLISDLPFCLRLDINCTAAVSPKVLILTASRSLCLDENFCFVKKVRYNPEKSYYDVPALRVNSHYLYCP